MLEQKLLTDSPPHLPFLLWSMNVVPENRKASHVVRRRRITLVLGQSEQTMKVVTMYQKMK